MGDYRDREVDGGGIPTLRQTGRKGGATPMSLNETGKGGPAPKE